MKLIRNLSILLACILSCAFAGRSALAQDYPTRPINFIIPFPPGGSTDLAMRALVEAASKILGQSIVIENKIGAGGTLGPAVMAQTARPDGYTISGFPVSLFRRAIIEGASYDPVKDFTYIAHVGVYAGASFCSTASGFKTWDDVIKFAKENPGKMTYASSGVASSPHIVMEYAARQSGVTFRHVPLRGQPEVVVAVAGGHIMCGAGGLDAQSIVDAGQAHYVNVHMQERLPSIPTVPTLKELGYTFLYDSFWGIAGPKGMPRDVTLKLQNAFEHAAKDEKVLQVFEKFAMASKFIGHEAFTKFVAEYMVSERKNLMELGFAAKQN